MAEIYYCVKCHKKTEMKDAQQVTMKNGKPALKGQCAECGTKMHAILSAKTELAAIAQELNETRHYAINPQFKEELRSEIMKGFGGE